MSVAPLFWRREGFPRARHKLSRKKSSKHSRHFFGVEKDCFKKATKQIDLGLTLGIIISSLWPVFVRNYLIQSAPRLPTGARAWYLLSAVVMEIN